MKVIRYRPIDENAWCYGTIKEAESILENGETWVMEVTDMTMKELLEMPEFEGW